jgi:hypothetical protein
MELRDTNLNTWCTVLLKPLVFSYLIPKTQQQQQQQNNFHHLIRNKFQDEK